MGVEEPVPRLLVVVVVQTQKEPQKGTRLGGGVIVVHSQDGWMECEGL